MKFFRENWFRLSIIVLLIVLVAVIYYKYSESVPYTERITQNISSNDDFSNCMTKAQNDYQYQLRSSAELNYSGTFAVPLKEKKQADMELSTNQNNCIKEYK